MLIGAAASQAVVPAFGSTASHDEQPSDWSFASPPDSSRPRVLWMWMGSNLSLAGITQDLEAMKSAGLGGATIFGLADTCLPWAGVIAGSPTPEIIAFTEPWWKLVRHAASQAYRLGLELALHNCAGYETSGGTWITPELSMQQLIWSKTKIQGGQIWNGVLDRPKVDLHSQMTWPQIFMEELGRVDVPTVMARRDYFVDVAVVAVPAEGIVSTDRVLLLSNKMDAQGSMRWDVPAGEWNLYRFGHTTTGAMIQPAQRRAMGLECDKMSKDAVTFHVEHVLSEMHLHLGEMLGKGITTLYFDSYEAGVPTWTPRMVEEFQARRGYDILSWLPAMAGHTLHSVEETAHFHRDFDRTREDLFRDCYWAVPRSLAHKAGLNFVAEPYDGPWQIEEVVGLLDTPAVEFWTHNGVFSPVSLQPVVEAAHRLGKPLIMAEAFTSDPKEARWDEHPEWLKPIGDTAFCAGVNRFNLHHFVQQPWPDTYRPGNTMGQWGVHFGRNQTWWEPGEAWIKYVWRCQNLLQRGEFVPHSDATSVLFLDIVAESGQSAKPQFQSIRRNLGEASIFFVANTARVSGSATLRLPVAGMQPELWDPVWGTTSDVDTFEQTNEYTSFPLHFERAQSFFVVFRKPARRRSSPRLCTSAKREEVLTALSGSWDVHFNPRWGGPATIQFPELTDWTLHPDDGIRFYSGTATYRKTLRLHSAVPDEGVWLDLGICHHLAEVTVNGSRIGVVWTAPWRIDVTKHLRMGDNHIELAVTNVWANRLIGDEHQPPDMDWKEGEPAFHNGYYLTRFPEWFLKGQPRPSRGRYTFTTWNYFTRDSPLVPSGLLGPVRILRVS